ncbi:MAG: hypothetical protein HQ561_13520 [Desulfobacteraceae bacterium]|nr:hypothetical protein [Desulfobacteraceae bacterium]
MKIEKSDIRGFYVGELLIHVHCMEAEDFAQITEDGIVTETKIKEMEEHFLFCDVCNKPL